MKHFISVCFVCFSLGSCSKPQAVSDYPTKYPETPTNGSWEEFKP